jgi:hypothetical protein
MYKYNKMEHTYHYKYKKYKSLYKMGGRDERLLDEVVDDDDEEFFPVETIESNIDDLYEIDNTLYNVRNNTLYTIDKWSHHFEVMSIEKDSGIEQIVILRGLPLENETIDGESVLDRIRSIGSFVGNEELVGVLVDTINGHILYFRDRTAPERLATGEYTPFTRRDQLVPDLASAAGGSY